MACNHFDSDFKYMCIDYFLYFYILHIMQHVSKNFANVTYIRYLTKKNLLYRNSPLLRSVAFQSAFTCIQTIALSPNVFLCDGHC